MARTIIHLDLDAFFCAVEEQRDPSLRGRPFAVGGTPETRGVVASCSYAARRFDIRSAMPMAQAIRRCPDLIVVPGRHTAYQAASRQVMARLHELTPLVEQLSIDEAFLDVSVLPQSGAALARQLQAAIWDGLGLPCSLGVASNKLVAKIATDVGKAAAQTAGPPNAILVVPPGEEAAFLAPLPTTALWGVGPRTAERLAELGLRTIGDLAGWPEADLSQRFGKHGQDLARRARGIDAREVVTSRAAKSISQETTFARDVNDPVTLCQTLSGLAAGVGRRLRQSELSGTTITLKLRWADFTTVTRQTTLRQPTDQDETIGAVAMQLFEQIWRPGQWVRLLGVGMSGLDSVPQQLSLWDSGDSEQQRRVRAAVQALRARFGEDVIRWGGDLPLDDR
ncbi:MAG TPA: DNA polymerase IV [Roseiflexaceae bacterium]|jgi:DNA polymerase-4